MRNISILLIAALSFGAIAAEGSRPPAGDAKRQDSQSTMKKHVLDHIDAKIRILQSAKACVRAASDIKAMVACHEQERKQTKELKEQARAVIQQRKPPSQPAGER